MKLSKAIHLALFAGLVIGSVPCARAADDGAAYVGLGADYSSGKYGLDSSTTIWDVPLTVGYKGSAWTVSLTVPYLHVSGPGNVIPGIGVVSNTNPQGRGRGGSGGTVIVTPTTYLSGSASGVGDVVAQATFHAVQNKDAGFGLDLTGRIKFGTASANKGLGTGQNDYTGAIDLYKTLGSAWTAFGGVAYTSFGSSSYIRLNDAWSANAGFDYAYGQGDSAGLYLFYQERIADTGFSRREASLYFNHKVSERWSLRGYLMGGFADGSPDYGVGMSARFSM